MKFFISSLIQGMAKMEALADWIEGKPFPDLGIELIAFTHNDEYWRRLEKLLAGLSCPVTFHGPYIGVEATAADGTKAQEWLFESYERVFKLAREYGVLHIVYHTTQLGFGDGDKARHLKAGEYNTGELLKMAGSYGVSLLVENLPYPKKLQPLYTNEAYRDFFNRFDRALSIVDIGHAHMNRMDIEPFLKIYGDRVKAYHFHNNDGFNDLHNSIMDGTFDFAEFAPVFKRYTPDANVVLEYEPHTKMSRQQLLADLAWISSKYQI